MSQPEQPFTISIPDSKLTLLQQKLALAEFPDELEGANRDYGVPLEDMKRVVERWRNGYDWRRFEKELNDELPQFTRDIPVDGHDILNVHYVHKKSDRKNAIPLLFVHGWPGSFLEVRKVIAGLTDSSEPGQPSFHVVAPSLPGFGFSEAPKKTGFGLDAFGETFHKLMVSLGYDKYVVQGGDWGHLITKHMALKYGGKHVQAWHTNTPFAGPPSFFTSPWGFLKTYTSPLSPREKASMEQMTKYQTKGNGYMVLQSTQPQTIGYALADSPVGLLGWIWEKLVEWTDGYGWEDDEVLDWISIFLFSKSGPAASLRIYYEIIGRNGTAAFIGGPRVRVPTGASYFPKDMSFQRESLMYSNTSNFVYSKFHETGGHFSAYEKPGPFVEDLKEMFGKGSSAFRGLGEGVGFLLVVEGEGGWKVG